MIVMEMHCWIDIKRIDIKRIEEVRKNYKMEERGVGGRDEKRNGRKKQMMVVAVLLERR